MRGQAWRRRSRREAGGKQEQHLYLKLLEHVAPPGDEGEAAVREARTAGEGEGADGGGEGDTVPGHLEEEVE